MILGRAVAANLIKQGAITLIEECKNDQKKLLYTREASMPIDIQHVFAEKGVEVITIPMNRTVFQPHKSLEHEYDWIFSLVSMP